MGWCHNLLYSCLKLRLRYLCDGLGKSWSAKCFRCCLLVGVLTFVGLLLVSEALGAKSSAGWVSKKATACVTQSWLVGLLHAVVFAVHVMCHTSLSNRVHWN